MLIARADGAPPRGSRIDVFMAKALPETLEEEAQYFHPGYFKAIKEKLLMRLTFDGSAWNVKPDNSYNWKDFFPKLYLRVKY